MSVVNDVFEREKEITHFQKEMSNKINSLFSRYAAELEKQITAIAEKYNYDLAYWKYGYELKFYIKDGSPYGTGHTVIVKKHVPAIQEELGGNVDD